MVDTRQIGGAATALLRELAGGRMDRAEARARLGLNSRQLSEALSRLTLRGYAEAGDAGLALTEAGIAASARGEVITGGPKGQVKIVCDTFRERAWSAMRARRAFTIGDIVTDAARDGDQRPHDNAARYISRLCQAGFVKEQARRRPGTAPGSNGFKVFVLVRRSGLQAPVWRTEANVVHDPNTGEDFACSRG